VVDFLVSLMAMTTFK